MIESPSNTVLGAQTWVSFFRRGLHTQLICIPSSRTTVTFQPSLIALWAGTDIGTITHTLGGKLGMVVFVPAATFLCGVRLVSNFVRFAGMCATTRGTVDGWLVIATRDRANRVGVAAPPIAAPASYMMLIVFPRLNASSIDVPDHLFVVAASLIPGPLG